MSNLEAPPAYTGTTSEPVPMKSIWDQPTSTTTKTRTYHEPKTVNKGLLILSLVCCTIFGKLALYYNREAEGLYNTRANEAGDAAARKARVWTWLGIIVGSIVLLLAIGGLTAWLVVRFALV